MIRICRGRKQSVRRPWRFQPHHPPRSGGCLLSEFTEAGCNLGSDFCVFNLTILRAAEDDSYPSLQRQEAI